MSLSASASASAASSTSILLHAYAFLLLLLAAAMVAAAASEHGGGRDVNMTRFTNTSAASAVEVETEMYYCFLCTGRNPILIHMCPIYWDTCFLDCWDWDAVDPGKAPPSPPSSSSVQVQNNDCYVMKLYMSGRYVIVQRMNCDAIGPCYLTCGGGELDDEKVTTAATIHQFVPSSDTEQLCGTQAAVNALRAPPSAGVVVPGAH